MSKNTLLISVASLKERTAIHTNTDEKLLAPVIKYAQDIHLVHATGSKLLRRLQEGIENSDLTTEETELLDDYVTDTLIHFVLSELPVDISYQFFTKGLIRKGGDNIESPSMDELKDVAQKFEARAEHYRERLISYLHLNRSAFADYMDCTDNDISAARSGYSIQCYLPDDDCECE